MGRYRSACEGAARIFFRKKFDCRKRVSAAVSPLGRAGQSHCGARCTRSGERRRSGNPPIPGPDLTEAGPRKQPVTFVLGIEHPASIIEPRATRRFIPVGSHRLSALAAQFLQTRSDRRKIIGRARSGHRSSGLFAVVGIATIARDLPADTVVDAATPSSACSIEQESFRPFAHPPLLLEAGADRDIMRPIGARRERHTCPRRSTTK
jgi:hypothetical protein